jgi:hypothetical protein
MNRFQQIHDYRLTKGCLSDPETLTLMEDTADVYRSLHQGMAPIGEWIQARMAMLVRSWLPEWHVSHGQIAELEQPDIQSRSWDLIIHRSIPKSLGFPPAASPQGPWPLVPKDLCCAVIDTKGQYNTPKKYAEKTVFNSDLSGQLSQIEFLKPQITPVLLILTSTLQPATVEIAGKDCGIETFVLARSINHKGGSGQEWVEWALNARQGSLAPLQALKALLLDAAQRWHRLQKCD